MLIQFSVENYRSISQWQTLSMVSSVGRELPNNRFKCGDGDLRLLKSAVIYGPNAAGKSNLLSAMVFAKRFILNSSKDRQLGEPIEITPFRLSTETSNAPSKFEFIFMQDGVRYQYGFSANSERVLDEYLMAFPKGKPQLWFERKWKYHDKMYDWRFPGYLKGKKVTLKEGTRDNALFLSVAIQLNNDQLKPVFSWFQETLKVRSAGYTSVDFTVEKYIQNEAVKKQVLDLMFVADIGLADIEVVIKKFSPAELPNDMPRQLKEYISEEMKDKDIPQIKTVHIHNDTGEKVYFDFDEESDGTVRFTALSGPLLDVLTNGRILIVDELDRSMHPKLVRFIVEQFHAKNINKKNAQLIFTTHDATLLDTGLFRRDQIWFLEKDRKQSSRFYPLLDYKPRSEEALEKGYLHGRYGALPFIKELDS